jgi:hypothetical protein
MTLDIVLMVLLLASVGGMSVRRGKRRAERGARLAGCQGYIGRWGTGKTMALASDGLAALRAGQPVYATFHLRDPRTGKEATWIDPGGGVEVMYGLRDCCLLIDEINLVFPSRKWATAPTDMLYLWAQGRKRGVAVRWSSQSERRVDTVIREVSHEIARVRVAMKWKGLPKLLRMQYYEPEDVGGSEKARAEKRIRSRWLVIRADVMKSYDTLEEVRPAEHIDAAKRAKAARPAARVVVMPGDRVAAAGVALVAVGAQAAMPSLTRPQLSVEPE